MHEWVKFSTSIIDCIIDGLSKISEEVTERGDDVTLENVNPWVIKMAITNMKFDTAVLATRYIKNKI